MAALSLFQEAIHRPFHPGHIARSFLSEPFAFILESGMDPSTSTSPRPLGRISMAGCMPSVTFRSRGRSVEVVDHGVVRRVEMDPFDALTRLLDIKDPAHSQSLTPVYVGYFSYDLRRFIENCTSHAHDDLALPDCILARYECVLYYDHHTCELTLTGIDSDEGMAGRRRLLQLVDELEPPERIAGSHSFLPGIPGGNFSHHEYLHAVNRVKSYVAAGDVYQVNLSQRFSAKLIVPEHLIYARLREISPAPFSAFLKYPEFTIVSASPERFLHYNPDDRIVHTRPIKGTRPRGGTPEEDERLKRELIASEKDAAEHIMIVDLERNDLGRVCEYGTVQVTEMKILESFPSVHHLTSTIEGRLRKDCDIIDLLCATFPGGSITGAPKIRSMEIIDELEPHARGVYTGSIGYIGLDGHLDLNIAIRTIIIRNGVAYFHVGGGIVADSDPEGEYQETLDKAAPLFKALGVE